MLHVQLLLHSNLAYATLHPELPCLVWLGRQRPFFALALYFVASSLGPISALLDFGVSHSFILSALVYELQDQGTQLEI